MSRIGKQPVELVNGVTAELKDGILTVKGSKGELTLEIIPTMKVEVGEKEITVTRPNDTKQSRAFHGLTRSLIQNMVEGVSKGFEKKLEIIGVGYRFKAAKNKITLNLGYSHPIEYLAPQEIEFSEDPDNKNIIVVKGIDKQIVGEVAAKVRSYRKPEPYKGKGIRYVGEYVARKAGKAAAKA